MAFPFGMRLSDITAKIFYPPLLLLFQNIGNRMGFFWHGIVHYEALVYLSTLVGILRVDGNDIKTHTGLDVPF